MSRSRETAIAAPSFGESSAAPGRALGDLLLQEALILGCRGGGFLLGGTKAEEAVGNYKELCSSS